MTCTAIILAGGASSRFGSDKLAALIDGRPLLHHVLSAVTDVADRIVLVLAPGAAVPELPRYAASVDVARDAVALGGPLMGLAAGLAAVPSEDVTGIVLVVGADMPSLQPTVLRLLVETIDREAGIAAVTLAAQDPSPLPMAIRPGVAARAIEEIIAAGGRRSLLALLDAVPGTVIPESMWRPIDPRARTLRDIDSPADVEGL